MPLEKKGGGWISSQNFGLTRSIYIEGYLSIYIDIYIDIYRYIYLKTKQPFASLLEALEAIFARQVTPNPHLPTYLSAYLAS